MKFSYSQTLQQYIAAAYNPDTRQVEIVDTDNDMCALMIRHGFMFDDDEQEEFDPLSEDELSECPA